MIEVEIMLTVEVEGRFVRGSGQVFDKSFGNYLPAEPSEIEDFKVKIVKRERDIDGREIRSEVEITHCLTDHEYNKLYNDLLVAYIEGDL